MLHLLIVIFGAASFAFFQFSALDDRVHADITLQSESEVHRFASYVDAVRTKLRQGNDTHLSDAHYQLQASEHRFGLSPASNFGYVAFHTESTNGRSFEGFALVYMQSSLISESHRYRRMLHAIFEGSCMYGWWTGSQLQSYCSHINLMRTNIPASALSAIPANSIVYLLQDPKPNVY